MPLTMRRALPYARLWSYLVYMGTDLSIQRMGSQALVMAIWGSSMTAIFDGRTVRPKRGQFCIT